MKKVLVILLVSAFVSAFAFADGITFGGWGRSGYVFQGGTGSDTVGTFPSWAAGSRVGLSVHGASANVGFDVDWFSAGAQPQIGDNARVWVKPATWLRFDFGKAQIDDLRGKVGDDWGDSLPSYLSIYSAAGDNDGIFTRFYPSQGFVVSLTPVEGLFIGVALDSNKLDSTGTATPAAAIAGIQVGAGYTIKDIGQVRVQYIGYSYSAGTATVAGVVNGAFVDANGKTYANALVTGLVQTSALAKSNSYIQAAFALTAVKNLTIDLGTKIPVDTSAAAALDRSKVALGVAYGADGLNLTLRAVTLIGSDVGFGVSLDGNYAVAKPLSLGVKVSYNGEVKDVGGLDLSPYATLNYANGTLGLGFVYHIDTSKLVGNAVAQNKWSVPFWSEFSF
jgi:hypothetical protein